MDKKKIFHGTLVLVVICLVSGLLLGLAYSVTAPIIEARELAEKAAAYQSLFPDAAEFVNDDALDAFVADQDAILEGSGYEAATINECMYALDADGNILGYCLSVRTAGSQDILVTGVGYRADHHLAGINILQNSESPGLGQEASKDYFTEQFTDKDVEYFVVTKRGASADNEIDALTGATITSNAVVLAVNAAMYFSEYVIANS